MNKVILCVPCGEQKNKRNQSAVKNTNDEQPTDHKKFRTYQRG